MFVLGWLHCSGDPNEFLAMRARQTQQEIQFSKTKKFQCCSDCSRNLSFEDNQRPDSQKSRAEHFK